MILQNKTDRALFHAIYLFCNWSDEIPKEVVRGPYVAGGNSKARLNWLNSVAMMGDDNSNSLIKYIGTKFRQYQGQTAMGRGRLTTPEDILRANEMLEFVILACSLDATELA